VPTERRDVEVHFPHRDPIVFSPLAFEPEPAKLAKASDWAIDISMARGADEMLVTVAHASPFAYFRLSRGDVRILAVHLFPNILPLATCASACPRRPSAWPPLPTRVCWP
jgi:hypothetical protein